MARKDLLYKMIRGRQTGYDHDHMVWHCTDSSKYVSLKCKTGVIFHEDPELLLIISSSLLHCLYLTSVYGGTA